jgi:hypothetical protein
LVKAAAGPIADWDEFSSILVKDESWSRRWRKIELRDRCTVFDESGIYFKGTDANGIDYLTAPLIAADFKADELAEEQMLTTATV